MLSKIFNKIVRKIKRKPFPSMVSGYKTTDGVKLNNVRISNSTFIDHKKNLTLDHNVYIGHFNFIEASNGITIEEGCQITNYVAITSHSSHNAIRLYGRKYGGSDMKGYVKGKVHIGKFTFVGPHVTIMPNTTVGKGCVIASHSYVKGDFPDFSIIAGVPAKVVGDTRDKDSQILSSNPDLKNNYENWNKD